MPVFAYYQRMMNAMRPFASKARFPKSVCNALIDGLDKHLTAIFRRNYLDHAILHNLQGSFQRSRLPTILDAMTMAEEEVQSISTIVHSSIGGRAFKSDALAFPSQTFKSDALAFPSQAFKSDALAFPSQAERTLDRYSCGYSLESGGYLLDGGCRSDRLGGSTGNRGLGQRDSCFGCKGIHPWV